MKGWKNEKNHLHFNMYMHGIGRISSVDYQRGL